MSSNRTARRNRRWREFVVHPAMEVYSSDGVLFGAGERIILEDGAVCNIVVSHGPGLIRRKCFDCDHVDRLVGDAVVLSLDVSAFSRWPDNGVTAWVSSHSLRGPLLSPALSSAACSSGT